MDVPLITLTTDFGAKDPFVGIMKGVILGIEPRVRMVDLTHEIAPQNVSEAALAVGTAYRYFPPWTIHLAVVDPGVGSARRPLLVVTDQHYFLAPDNGLLSLVFEREESVHVRHVTAEHYFLQPMSATFHARDLFAPVAGWLARGIDISVFGEEVEDYVRLDLPHPRRVGKEILEGQVLSIDRFGNATTNITWGDLEPFLAGRAEKDCLVVLKGEQIAGLSRFYAEREEGGLGAVLGSAGYLEIFAYRGNAAERWGIRPGDEVAVLLSER
jgi:S-adenosylmethionine hydrolase